jgi:hypothetical protein
VVEELENLRRTREEVHHLAVKVLLVVMELALSKVQVVEGHLKKEIKIFHQQYLVTTVVVVMELQVR